MTTFLTALAPILAVIALGFALKRTGFLPEAAWSGMEKLTYFVLFPALLVRTLGGQTLTGVPWLPMLLVVIGTLTLATLALVAWHRLSRTETNATFTSIFQGGVRFNTYIALAVALGLYGAEGLALASVAAGFMIVLINLLCVSAFVGADRTEFSGTGAFVREVLSNPLIIACAIGWLLSLTGIRLPGVTDDILEVIGRAALPFGLLAVGAALKPEMVRGHALAIVVSTLVQLGLKPLAAVLLAYVTGLNGIAAAILVLAFMTPTAPSAYILARQLGGDTEAMASIITAQTLLAFLVMPMWAWALLR